MAGAHDSKEGTRTRGDVLLSWIVLLTSVLGKRIIRVRRRVMPAVAAGNPQTFEARHSMRIGAICLNWKVVAGLAVMAAGIRVVAPQVFLSALPVLAVLACPLSMLIMMRGMNGMGSTQSHACNMSPSMTPSRRDQAPTSAAIRETRLAELHTRLKHARAEQEALARELAMLTGAGALEATDPPVVRQAEAVARAADESIETEA